MSWRRGSEYYINPGQNKTSIFTDQKNNKNNKKAMIQGKP